MAEYQWTLLASYSTYIPNDRPLDTEVLWGSFLTGLWDSKKLSSSRCRAFSMGNVALLLSDMPYWHIILWTEIKPVTMHFTLMGKFSLELRVLFLFRFLLQFSDHITHRCYGWGLRTFRLYTDTMASITASNTSSQTGFKVNFNHSICISSHIYEWTLDLPIIF